MLQNFLWSFVLCVHSFQLNIKSFFLEKICEKKFCSKHLFVLIEILVTSLNHLLLYVVVKAYQYTSLTSVMLLDCWSIPSVILLTWLFLNTKYRFRKFVGVAVCVAGLVLVVFSDVHSRDRGSK